MPEYGTAELPVPGYEFVHDLISQSTAGNGVTKALSNANEEANVSCLAKSLQ